MVYNCFRIHADGILCRVDSFFIALENAPAGIIKPLYFCLADSSKLDRVQIISDTIF